jgi:hypothetical protein
LPEMPRLAGWSVEAQGPQRLAMADQRVSVGATARA